MATESSANFLAPNMAATNNTDRPLSTYDNLNSSALPSSSNQMNGKRTPPAQTEKEFPFSDISFKFDDLPQQQNSGQTQHTNNNNINYNHHSNHNGNNNNNNNTTIHHNSIKSINNNFIKNNNNTEGQLSITSNHGNSIRNSSGSNSCGTPANNQTHKCVTSSIVKTTTNQYENVCDTVKLRNLQKSAISDAKSSFFGITTGSASTMPTNKYHSLTNEPSTSTNTDRVPLIVGGTSSSSVLCQRSPPPQQQSSAYQNIPLNSACFATQNNCIPNYDGNQVENNCVQSNSFNSNICENEKNSSLSNTSTKSVSPSMNNNNDDDIGDTLDNCSGMEASPSTSSAGKYFAEASERMNHSPSQVIKHNIFFLQLIHLCVFIYIFYIMYMYI